MKIYTFIHPTKTGGTAVEEYFSENYSNYITGIGHIFKCSNNNNSIIIVRDAKSRFLSIYKYWKNGAIDTHYKPSSYYKEKNKDITILDFINIWKTNKEYLLTNFTWDQHFHNITEWIGNTEYKNIIIIKYEKDLNNKIQKLINYLGIKNKNIPLKKCNISCTIDNEDELLNHPDVINFVEEYFKDDINLLNTIENNPELFKLVI
jgi:hypothetical protein